MGSMVDKLVEYGRDVRKSVSKLCSRYYLLQAIQVAQVLATALIFYRVCMFVADNESPVVVILSGSMLPGMRRGDIMFLWNSNAPLRTGDIVVYEIPGREVPIIHRVIRVHARGIESEQIMTKGDNNFVDDAPLYDGRDLLSRDFLVGRAVGSIPYAGYLTILLNESGVVKYAIVGALVLLSFFLD
ncbi:Signal peptidase complex catalytic subunit SEC11 [Porphyridium purpureum]|uniref:Signal peptidase complex catalytic subunit SEC11 n=1 Tax=Porphyridium purpureum TaxID=35688 RepID=A0A5J4Z9H2_PORPP|nr:Signal peptidase complex catalytic subunit SEC11 [Porphyridium purpureum]|eukprot:POR1671..scf295_1